MKFYTEDDLTHENFKESWKVIEELSNKAEEETKLIKESPKPTFQTGKEYLQYYNAIPFEEWENNMKAKYDL